MEAQRGGGDCAPRLEQLDTEIYGAERGSGEPARSRSRSRRKTRWRWIMSIASWPKNSRARQSRLSVARSGAGASAPGRDRARAQQERDQQLLDEKETARSIEEQVLEQSRADFEELQAEAHQLVEEHAALRAELAGFEERQRSERAAPGAPQNANRRDRRAAGRRFRRKWSGWASSAPACWPITSSWTSAPANLLEEIRSAEETGDAAGRAGDHAAHQLAALEEALEAAAHRRAGRAGEALADRTRAGQETGRAEVSGRDQPQGAERSARRIGRQRRRRAGRSRVEEAEQKYQEVKARIEALGPVNPQALEEFQEAQQRYDFLNAQRQDLLDSIRDTEKAIHDIDIESRKRFKEAFDAINGHFRESVPHAVRRRQGRDAPHR